MSKALIIGGILMMIVVIIGVVVYFTMMTGEAPVVPEAPAPPTPPAAPTYRYVRIIRNKDGDDHWLNLAEVEVFSEGTNVARGKTVTASTKYNNSDQFPHSNLVDGNKTNFAHTQNEPVEWFVIDLGQNYEIEKVVITNRTDCCQGRLRNTKIQLSKAADISSPTESRVITTEEGPKATITWVPKLGADLTAA